jgi:uncharacterized protein DUF3263
MQQHVAIERNENITTERAGGSVWDVRDITGAKIGIVVHGDAGWRVFSAGYGVPVDHNAVYPCRDRVVAALNEARAVASEPGGALAVDDSGLTGHQRAAIDMMRRYAMVSTAKRDAIIWDHFDMTPTQFFSEWNALIDNPDAARYCPSTINRHRRLRDQRKAARTRATVSA